MFLRREALCHISTVSHEGKLVVVATDKQGKHWYTVKQDGFEDSYLTQPPDDRTGWEDWQPLELPDEPDDESVLQLQAKRYTTKADPDSYLLRSRYRSTESAVVPVQLLSALGHVYVFRQSTEGRLWVDRYVLDGLTNSLGRKIEVRFKRSRQKHKPASNSQSSRSLDADSLDYTDINGKRFFEPTTELTMVSSLHDGWFSIVLLPTNEQDRHRWHVFSYNAQNKRIELTSLLASEDGLFDLNDHTVLHPEVKKVPAIVRHSFDLGNLQVTHGITATRFDVQRERQTDDGVQLLRESVRVMLLAATSAGNVTALNLAAAADGSLSRISADKGVTNVLRSEEHPVLLPLNVLEEIKSIGTTEPPADGTVKAIERGERDTVVIKSGSNTGLSDTELTQVKITGNPDRNELYSRVGKVINDNTFEVKPTESIPGQWEVVPPEETGLTFNGAVSGYQLMPGGNLRVTAMNHGLQKGDSVQLVDTPSYNGTYSVTRLDNNTFSLDGLKWRTGTAISASLQSQKRRGVLTGDNGGLIRIPEHSAPTSQMTLSLWLKSATDTWVSSGYIVNAPGVYALEATGEKSIDFHLYTVDGTQTMRHTIDADISQWMHLAALFTGHQLQLYVNGILVSSHDYNGKIVEQTSELLLGEQSSDSWTLQLAEVNLWEIARTGQEIKDTQHLPLSGDERGLLGYWRLDSIIEDEQRTVVDLSANSLDGLVMNGAYLSGVALNRRLSGGNIDAIKLVNDDLFAVSERATYREQFDFKTDTPFDWMDEATPPFSINCTGKKNRNSQQWHELDVSTTTIRSLGNGWFKATAVITVADGINLLRSFGIADFTGDWRTLTVRNHQVTRISDSISELTCHEPLAQLSVLGSTSQEPQAYLSTIRSREARESRLIPQLAELKKTIAELELLQSNRTQAIADNKRAKQQIRRRIGLLESTISRLNSSRRYWAKAVGDASHKVTFHWNNNQKGKSFSRQIGRASTMPSGWNDEVASITVPASLQLVLYQHTHYRGGAMLFNVSHNLSQWKIPGTKTNWKNEASSYVIQTTDGKHTNLSELKSKLGSTDAQLAANTTELTRARAEESRLNQFSADRDVTAELGEAQKTKLLVEQELASVQSALQQNNRQFTASVASLDTSSNKLIMPRINDVSDPLETRAAVLDFIHPASRLQAVESCVGEVQVNHFDQFGRRSQAIFDATSDSRNTSFEQWLPNRYRHCLNLSGSRSAVTLKDSIALQGDWTIEAWIYHQTDGSIPGATIAAGGRRDEHIGIFSNAEGHATLATMVNGKTFESGVDLDTLPAGWYHIAAVGEGEDEDSTTTFYLNGELAGEPVPAKSTERISMIGNRPGIIRGGNNRRGGSRQPEERSIGKIAEFRVWDTALSSDELLANSQHQLSANEPGLLASFTFDQSSGNTVSDTTGDNTGTVSNGQWWAFTAPMGQQFEHAIHFDGKDDYIEIPHQPDLNTAELTVSCWARATGGENTYRAALCSRDSQSTDDSRSQGYMFYAGDNNRWQFWTGNGSTWQQVVGSEVVLDEWVHLCATHRDGKTVFYVNGVQAGVGSGSMEPNSRRPLRIGAGATEGAARYRFHGQVSEVCVWQVARSAGQVQAEMYRRCNGSEPGLSACFPLDEISLDDNGVRQVCERSTTLTGTLRNSTLKPAPQLVLGSDSIISAEYSTVGADRTAMMRRFYATATGKGLQLLTGQRIDLLDLQWIGNGQFEPTLLGYIEGAPPVPSENLTINDDYRTYISVELNLTNNVSFNWTREQDAGLGASIDTFIGSDVRQSIVAAPLGVGAEIESVGVRAGFKGNLDFSYQFQNSSSITSSTSLDMTDSLNMVGTKESNPHFPHLGKRFIPKNVGYALVVSALADVFITRLMRTGTMIGYQVMPVENMPPDVNTITFLINPAYTMNGSLDGMTGSSATSRRFHKHVPSMRSTFGSRYPASYYRLDEAYNLKQKIEKQDKNREAYFSQFNSLRTGRAGISQNISQEDETATDLQIGGRIDSEKNLTAEQREELARQREEDAKQLEEDTEKRQQEQKQKASEKRIEIAKRIDDQSQRNHANASFAAWQKKMEDIQIRSGKRNIVNTYVWDADGGFRSESQSFANAAEHSIGGSFSLNAGMGFEGNFKVLAASVELTAQATANLTQTMSKTESRSQGVNLNVDLRGVESRGVTDHNDQPLMPGEKVNRYRFMSYYLEGSTSHFNDFFDQVVDPEWLAGNSEEARALRQAQGKANKTWRVLHRVTYVERPALQGFGQDPRSLLPQEKSDELEQLQGAVGRLQKTNTALEKKLDTILKMLKTPA